MEAAAAAAQAVADAQASAPEPGPKTPDNPMLDQAPLVVELVVPEPAVGAGSDLTVNIMSGPASDQRQLATSSGRAQALTDSGFPLLATPDGVRNPGRSQDPEIPNKEAESRNCKGSVHCLDIKHQAHPKIQNPQ